MKKNQTNQNSLIYQDVLDAMPDGLIINEISTGLVLEVNQTMADLHGYTREECIGLHFTDFVHPQNHPLWNQYIESVQTGSVFKALALHLRRDGSSFYVEWRGTYFIYEGKQCLLGNVRDVNQRIEEDTTLRKWVEERTHEQSILLEISEAFASALELKPSFILEQIRGIIDYSYAGLFTVEESTLIVLNTHNPKELEQAPPLNMQVDVPEALTSLFTKQRPVRIADVNSDEPSAQKLRAFLSNESASMLKGIQSWMWVPLVVKGRIIAVIGLAHYEPDYFNARHADMAMTLANQAAITVVNAELVENAQGLAVLQERQRLARNLHDAVNQSLFSAGLIAEVLPQLWEQNHDEARTSLEDLRKLTRGAIAEMRMLVSELRPLALTDSNLSDLLHQLANAFTGRTNIPVSVSISGEDILVSEVQVAVYRICQEALNNIAKHANPSNVKIKLQYNAGKVELRIKDNGRGFDPSLSLPGHYGLSMMHERANAVKANLEITSEPWKGSEVIFRWQEATEQENT